MRYKVLLTGNQDSVIEDFFSHTEDVFISMSTSDRIGDIELHTKLFQPDVFVYCSTKETGEQLHRMQIITKHLKSIKVPFVVIGDKEDLERIDKVVPNVMDLILMKPISIDRIKTEIIDLIEEEKREEEKARLLKEKRERQMLMAKAGAKSMEPKHILVIDDDPIMLRTVKHYLEEKYQVATALSGKIALKYLSQKTADLILLDYEMPEQSGTDVLKTLRRNSNTMNIPIVFLTGVSDVTRIQEVLALSPQGYLLKPVDYEKLHQTIAKILFDE